MKLGSASRLFVLTAVLGLLSACGFQSVHSPGAAGSSLQGRVQVIEPVDRNAFLMVQRLEERLGRAADPNYILSFDIAVEEQGLAVDPEGDVLRFNLVGVANYALRNRGTGQIALSGQVDNFTGYSATGTTVASLAAERDARGRLMTILADEIVIRLQSADLVP